MEKAIILWIFNRSLRLSAVCLAIHMFRLLLKTQKKHRRTIWLVFCFRAVIPKTIESSFSLIPSASFFNECRFNNEIYINSGIAAFDGFINPYINVISRKINTNSGFNLPRFLLWVWVAGVSVLSIYTVTRHVKTKIIEKGSISDNSIIFSSALVRIPFVYGVTHPKYIIPTGLSEEERRFFIKHEQEHINKCDILWFVLGWVISVFNWFNPIIWVSYKEFCFDIESACDERVLSSVEKNDVKKYVNFLIKNSPNLSNWKFENTVSFSGYSMVKRRVKVILNPRKANETMAVVTTSIACLLVFLDPVSAPLETNPYDSRIKEGYDEQYICDLSEWFGQNSEFFRIGVNSKGQPVFVDPERAFVELKGMYYSSIQKIAIKYHLFPISYRNYWAYAMYGWQEGSLEGAFISAFFDVYENSYS